MSYSVKAIPKFDKEIKHLVKKYQSLKDEYINLVALLKANPFQRISLGNNCFKIRIAISSKGNSYFIKR